MARTQYLDEKALQLLRSALREKYLQRNPGQKPVPATTYKEAYEELRDDILRVAPDAHQSVSLIRLRKLFYYTDSSVCDPAQLENASFGKDFLDALYLYAGPAGKPPIPPPLPSNRWRTAAFILLALASLSLWRVFDTPAPASWEEHFEDTDLARLESNDWEILDFDTALWRRQPRPGMLALYTAPGDYWVKPGEPRRVANLLLRELPGPNTDISTRLVDFYPLQNHQQAGFFLLNKDKSRLQYLRVTYGFGGPLQGKGNATARDSIPGTLGISLVAGHPDGDVIQHPFPFYGVSAGPHDPVFDTVYLRLALRQKKCSVYYKNGYSWGQYHLITAADLDFKPAYVGLTAFQGWTNDDRTPKGADTIPAFFDWVKVEGKK